VPTSLPFPALVTSPTGEHWPMARPRLLGPDDTLEVFAYEKGAVRLVAEVGPVAAVRAVTPGKRWEVEAGAGTWVVEKGRGCGCGHPLKRANLDQVARRDADLVST
jgi:hypothetical protein